MKKMLFLSALALLSVHAATAEEAPEGNTVCTETTDVCVMETENASNSSSIGNAILMYVPNRLIDLSDLFSISLGLGGEAAAEVALTQYAQLGGAYGSSFTALKGFDRQYGIAQEEIAEYGAGCWNYNESYVKGLTGTINEYLVIRPEFIMVSENADVYRDKDLDFWAVSVKAGWLINVGFGIHPTQFPDFLAGFLCMDPSGDDL